MAETKKSFAEQEDVGTVCFTLDEFRKAKGISKNQICINANVQRTQLQNYCKNKVARVALFVLARICNYLECEIGDIMKYVPPKKCPLLPHIITLPSKFPVPRVRKFG